MQLDRLSILGVGLLGGSIGLAAKSSINNCYITGYGHRMQTLEQARAAGAIDHFAVHAADAVRDADLVILCTPVGVFPALLREIAPALKPGAIVTDVGSTKRTVVKSAEEILPAGIHFVGSHPIAGSEKRGVAFARADLMRDALCLITPTDRTDKPSLATVEQFWKLLGMKTAQLSPEAHDQALAEVSHLPHALAAALMQIPSPTALGVCGRGFEDTTRIAGGDAELWRDIFIDNRDNLREALERLSAELQRLTAWLDRADGQALADWLGKSAQRREQLAEIRNSQKVSTQGGPV